MEYCRECKQGGGGVVLKRAVCNSYNDRLKEILGGENKDFSPLDLGCPSDALLSTGLSNMALQMSVKTLLGKGSQANHPFKLPDVVHLPDYLADPIAIFRSASTVEDRKVVLTEMKSEGHNIIVIIATIENGYGEEINSVRSLYPKDNPEAILGWIEAGLLEYCHKEKILDWLGKHQSNSDEVTKLLKVCTKIVQQM